MTDSNAHLPAKAPEQEPPPSAAIESADAGIDWAQVRLNGGPPCFHIEDHRGLCGRAARWDGHRPGPDDYPYHEYTTLAAFLEARDKAIRAARDGEIVAAMQAAARSDESASGGQTRQSVKLLWWADRIAASKGGKL